MLLKSLLFFALAVGANSQDDVLTSLGLLGSNPLSMLMGSTGSGLMGSNPLSMLMGGTGSGLMGSNPLSMLMGGTGSGILGDITPLNNMLSPFGTGAMTSLGLPAAATFSPYGQQFSPYGQQFSPYGQQLSPYGQQFSPYGHQLSPYGQALSPYGAAYPGAQSAYMHAPYGAQHMHSSPYNGPMYIHPAPYDGYHPHTHDGYHPHPHDGYGNLLSGDSVNSPMDFSSSPYTPITIMQSQYSTNDIRTNKTGSANKTPDQSRVVLDLGIENDSATGNVNVNSGRVI